MLPHHRSGKGDLGAGQPRFVSAYVLARGGEAAVVDTGTAGSEGDIAAALERIGLGWDAVGHVIVTHLHGDHAGGLAAVLGAAPDATGYAGQEDSRRRCPRRGRWSPLRTGMPSSG